VVSVIEGLKGVERVLARNDAAREFSLMPDRIGDLIITGDIDTVFGTLDQESETLAASYRSHGSRYEQAVPLIIHDEKRKVRSENYRQNLDLTTGLVNSI
jgi:phosphonoacetate hydrolase